MAGAEQPGALTPAIFFEQILPRYLAAAKQSFNRGPLICTFQILGQGGGTWSADLTDGKVWPDAAAKPSCTLQAEAQTFTDLLNASEFDVERALAEGRLVFEGAPGMLKVIALLLLSGRPAPDDAS